MQFQARVRATVLIPFEADVPTLEFEQAQPDPDDDTVKPISKRPSQQAVNEDLVLQARATAGRAAEQLAADAFNKFTVLGITVEEVVEQ